MAKRLVVIKKFFESDCPVVPGGTPVPGAETTSRDIVQIKNDLTPADVQHAAACLGLQDDGTGNFV